MPARNVNAVIVLIKENVVTLSYIHHILVPSFQVNVFDFLVWESGIPIILLKLFASGWLQAEFVLKRAAGASLKGNCFCSSHTCPRNPARELKVRGRRGALPQGQASCSHLGTCCESELRSSPLRVPPVIVSELAFPRFGREVNSTGL